MRQGKVWDPVLAAREKEERLQRQKLDDEDNVRRSGKKKNEQVPKSTYQDKYSHLIGTDADMVTIKSILIFKISW